LAEIINHITNKLIKGSEIKWISESRKYFEDIKVALIKAPILSSPNFAKDLILFYFSSEHTIVGVFLQEYEHNFERPISYYNMGMWNSPLKYDIMEKQGLCTGQGPKGV
jgi:hypothetical protein